MFRLSTPMFLTSKVIVYGLNHPPVLVVKTSPAGRSKLLSKLIILPTTCNSDVGSSISSTIFSLILII